MDFLGTFYFNLDDKNRLILPAKWRATLSSDVVISQGYDGALELRSLAKFQEYYNNELSLLDFKNKNARLMLRKFLGNAANLVVDRAFRILIPNHLIQLAEIQREVCLVGLGSVIEIWDASKYAEFQKQNINTLETASENLS
ncbi:Transcriptional regulator MraZ [[Mycoplasma] cavipharyngis]